MFSLFPLAFSQLLCVTYFFVAFVLNSDFKALIGVFNNFGLDADFGGFGREEAAGFYVFAEVHGQQPSGFDFFGEGFCA